MQVTLDNLHIARGSFSLTGNGVFEEGVHLVWGPVGTGKSTMALALASVLVPASGGVTKEGIATFSLSLQFPEYHVTARTIEEEIRSWGVDPVRVLRVAGLIEKAGEDPLTLSRGELKRLELWCAITGDPDLLILDEPFSSLDCTGRSAFVKALERRTDGITILFTHSHGALPAINFLWEIQGGSLVRRGNVPEALQFWSSPPPYLKYLLDRGIVPRNISLDAVREAGCKTED